MVECRCSGFFLYACHFLCFVTDGRMLLRRLFRLLSLWLLFFSIFFISCKTL